MSLKRLTPSEYKIHPPPTKRHKEKEQGDKVENRVWPSVVRRPLTTLGLTTHEF